MLGAAAFGLNFAALILAAAVYVSSSAVTVKGLIDFRRLADDETDLVLAILVFEDLVIGLVIGFAGGGGGALLSTLVGPDSARTARNGPWRTKRDGRRGALPSRGPGPYGSGLRGSTRAAVACTPRAGADRFRRSSRSRRSVLRSSP